MKKFAKFITSILAVTLITPATFATQTTLTAQDYANYLIEALGVTSVQYAIIKDGDIITSAATGMDSASSQTSTELMYGIGSISKVYTTASIMKLVDLGLIDLDKPVTTYVDDFKMADDRYKDITVKMLLNHSSGLMEGSLSNTVLYADNDTQYTDNLLERLSTQRLNTAPGEVCVYNNGGFSLAEIVIERVSGLSYTEFLETYITQPLGLENTVTPQSEFDVENLVNISTYQGQIIQDAPVETLNAIGTGGIYSTAEDLCLFVDAFFLNDEFLTQQAIDLTTTPQYQTGLWGTDKMAFEYGLGWDEIELYPFNEQDIQVLSKSGDTLTYSSALLVAPQYDIAVAVLATGGNSTFNTSFAGQMLIDELIKDGVMEQPAYELGYEVAEMVTIPDELLVNSGLYGNILGAFIYELNPEGTLDIYLNDEFIDTFYHQGDGKFVDKYGSQLLEFEALENGHNYAKVNVTVNTGLMPVLSTNYYGQQLEEKEISDEVKAAWEARYNKTYYLLNEKYTSFIYTSGIPAAMLYGQSPVEGYCGQLEIINENTLYSNLAIPGMYSRDGIDLHFYNVDGVEFLMSGSSIYGDESFVNPLKYGTYEIAEDGYAKHFSVDEDMTVSIDMIGNGIFALYDLDGICIYNSILEPNKPLEIQAGSMLVFAGDIGTSYIVE
ncbi:MAG: hypothetical protein BEN18_11020 [Epulopiscium sp. Nuni2H_MBin001]|nr:MAG: hypothetical protein BEN18_11020 [Epulopiscium sp. Nuni2H_MBin001]